MFEDKNTGNVSTNPIDDIFADVDTDFNPVGTPPPPPPASSLPVQPFGVINKAQQTSGAPLPPPSFGSGPAITPSPVSWPKGPVMATPQKQEDVRSYAMEKNEQNPFPINPGVDPVSNLTPRFPQNPIGNIEMTTPSTIASRPPQPLTALPGEGGSRKWILIVILLLLAAAGAGAWYSYNEIDSVKKSVDETISSLFGSKKTADDTKTGDQTNTDNNTNQPGGGINITPTENPSDIPKEPVNPDTATPTDEPVTTPDTNTPTGSDTGISNPIQPTPDTGAVTDSDHDGLSDTEEETLGTDPLSIDTDGDGLFDYEEVKIFKTDPLNKDTDKDGYSDFAEVKNGYNPTGPGKLPTVN